MAVLPKASGDSEVEVGDAVAAIPESVGDRSERERHEAMVVEALALA